MGRGPARPIKFSEAGPPPGPARQFLLEGGLRPGPAHDIRSKAHNTRASYGPARGFEEPAHGWAHGLAHVLPRTKKCTLTFFYIFVLIIIRVVLRKIPEVIFPCCTSVPVLGGIPSYLGKPCTAEGGTVKNRKTVNRLKSTVILQQLAPP